VRLRELDIPELDTFEGRTAREFVSDLLVKDTEIALTTTKPDKYDRYLGDVFLGEGTARDILKAVLFLNRMLLEGWRCGFETHSNSGDTVPTIQ
jgi:endonuclease YncB( thermonuclease family)